MIRGGPGQILHFDWLLPSDAWRVHVPRFLIRHGIEVVSYPDPALLVVLNQQPCDSDLYGSFPLCGHVMTSISPRVVS